MISLTYISSAVDAFPKADLVLLLEDSRKKNLQRDITGMLLFQKGSFIQVIEGLEEIVENLYAAIAADPRHKGLIRLLKEPIERRAYADWSMGFRNLSDPDLRDLPGYNEYINVPFNADFYRNDPNRARRLLNNFRRNTTR